MRLVNGGEPPAPLRRAAAKLRERWHRQMRTHAEHITQELTDVEPNWRSVQQSAEALVDLAAAMQRAPREPDDDLL